jgi:hypothetical protein
MFSLGDELKDSVTGFTGVAIAKTDWIHQCTRWTLQPKVGKDGKIPDNATFDEPALVLLKAGAVAAPKKKLAAFRTTKLLCADTNIMGEGESKAEALADERNVGGSVKARAA